MIKSGVKLHPSTAWAVGMSIIREVYKDFGYVAVITSGIDGKHRTDSLHYSGNAFDFRTNSVSRSDLHQLVHTIQDALGDNFDVLLEHEGRANEHLHVEFDP